jgi:phosphoribosylformylglycinamidine synthase
MIGRYTEEIAKMVPSAFKAKGHTIYLLGKLTDDEEGRINANLLLPLVEAIKDDLVESVFFLGESSLVNALVECSTPRTLGFDITTDSEMDEKEFLDGNCGYAALITLNSRQENSFVEMMYDSGVSLMLLGHVTKGSLRIDDRDCGFIGDYIK